MSSFIFPEKKIYFKGTSAAVAISKPFYDNSPLNLIKGPLNLCLAGSVDLDQLAF